MEINEKTLMRDVLVNFLRERMSEDKSVMVIDADLAKCVP